MPKKKKRQHEKHAKRARGAPSQRTPTPSPQAVAAITTQFANLRPHEFLVRMEAGLLGSWVLRQEPEFKDLYFDSDQLVKALASHAPKYKDRLEELMRKGDEEKFHQLYDELRIDIIADLVTTTVRRDLQERTKRCLQRLARGQDTDKLEMAVFADLLLSDENPGLPLGVCGLFTAIYEDSRQQTAGVFQAWESLEESMSGLFPGRKPTEVSPEEWLAAAEKPEAVAQITQVLAQHPELRASMEKDYDRLIEEVREDILDGKIRLDFFTEEEAMIAYADLFNALSGDLRHGKMPNKEAVGRKFVDLMRHDLAQLLTPERNRQFFQRLETLAQKLTQAKDREQQKMGMKLQLAARSMDRWDLGKHPLIEAAYIYQCQQAQERGLAGGATAERNERFARLVAERATKGGRKSL